MRACSYIREFSSKCEHVLAVLLFHWEIHPRCSYEATNANAFCENSRRAYVCIQ